MAAHRYWRIYITAGNGAAFVGVSEVEFRTSISGADQTGSGTASASTAFGGLPASNAFNNGGGDWASDGSAFPQWLKYDFGSGNDKDIVEAYLTSRSPANQNMVEWQLEYSDNDSTWTPLFYIHDSTWAASTATGKAFNATDHPTRSVANQVFWRVNTTAADGGGVVAIGEIEMRTVPAGADQCTGGTAYAQTVLEEGPTPSAARAFDNVGSQYWAAASNANQWVGYKFSATKAIVVLVITARSGSPSQSPKNFTLQYWDGSAFQTAFTLTNITGWTAGQTRYFDSTGEISAPVASASARPVVCVCC